MQVPPATAFVHPPAATKPALAFHNVSVDVPGRRGLLVGINLAVASGEVAVVKGRSGGGKSTLLAVAAGLLEPIRGHVAVAGRILENDADGAQRRARNIGFVFQHYNLIEELTIRENIELPLRLRAMPKKQRAARVDQLLDRFGLQENAAQRPSSLSGGEQQRVAVARALAGRPKVLLVDEPTSSLDEANARVVAHSLRQAAESGAAVLVASHDELMNQYADRVYTLNRGRLEG